MFGLFYGVRPIHTYTLTSTGLKRDKSCTFNSREAAKLEMYKLMTRFGLKLDHVYDDKHYKTYIFTNGVRIYINRD